MRPGRNCLGFLQLSRGGDVTISVSEAVAAITGPGQPFELVDVEVDGVTNRSFKNAPPTLREFFASSRGLHETFLVY